MSPFTFFCPVQPVLHSACTAACWGGGGPGGLHPMAPESPGAQDSPGSVRSCELWLCGWEGRVSHPWPSWWRVVSKHTGLFALVLNKHPSIAHSLSIIPLSLGTLQFVLLQIGSFSFASPLQHFPRSDCGPCSPLKGVDHAHCPC